MRPNYSRKRLGLGMGLGMGLGLGVLGLVGCPSDNTSGADMGDMAAAGPFLKGPRSVSRPKHRVDNQHARSVPAPCDS